MRSIQKKNILTLLYEHLFRYPTPINLNYFWGFGSLAGICLAIQIITGLFLSMHYVPSIEFAFDSIQHIVRDVNYGWLMRYIHSNGASIFFAVVYIHIARSIYYKTYLHGNYSAWVMGVVLFILMMAIAFLGYILPWGQMSLWGATVITNLFSAIPIFGKSIVYWLWGGFSVANPTLARFYSLHFFLPFVLAGLIFVHIALIHEKGSHSPTRYRENEFVPFFPYFFAKDLFGLLCMIFVWAVLVIYYPNWLGHPDNYISANEMVTPRHIVPEWYFLPFYAILRSIPNKLMGVIYMFSAILIWFIIPIFESLIFGSLYVHISILDGYSKDVAPKHQPAHQYRFWFLIATFILLGWIGGKPAIEPYTSVSLYLTALYFFLLTAGHTFCSIFDELTVKLKTEKDPHKTVLQIFFNY